ncbi:MAG: hypothetical protein ABIQ12_06450, partial [Opitutaceae bacterium]
MKPRLLLAPLVTLLGALAAPVSLLAQAKVEAVVVAPATQTPSTFHFDPVSKSGLRGVSLVPKGSRFAYLVDGVEGPRFDRGFGQISLTADGSHHAYSAIIGTEAILVIDGKEVARVAAKNGQSPFIKHGFSRTGKRFWYVQDGIEKDRNFYQRLMVDGQAVGDFAGIGTFVYSPDESRYAVLVTKLNDQREFLVLDGKDV